MPEIIFELNKKIDVFKTEQKTMFIFDKLLIFCIKYEFQENESLDKLKEIELNYLNKSKAKDSESLSNINDDYDNELTNGLLKQNNIQNNKEKIELLLKWLNPTNENTIQITDKRIEEILNEKKSFTFYDYLSIYSYVKDSDKDIFLYNEKFEHLILKIFEEKIFDAKKIKAIRSSLKLKSLGIASLSIQTLKKIYSAIENFELVVIENKCLYELLKLIKMINSYSNKNKGPKIKEIFLKKDVNQREILINSSTLDFISYFDFFLEIFEPLEFINSFLSEQKILEKFCNQIKSPKAFQKFSKKIWSLLDNEKREMMKDSEYGKIKIFNSTLKNKTKCSQIIFFWRKQIKKINCLGSEMKKHFIYQDVYEILSLQNNDYINKIFNQVDDLLLFAE